MTNRLLHTDAKGTTLEITDTGGIHRLVTTHEQGAATVVLAVDIPAHQANALIAATPVYTSTFAPTNHKFDWEKRKTIDPKLLRDALLVALNDQDALWDGVRDGDAQSVPAAAERAATVVERLLDGSGNQVPPWTPTFAVNILRARMDDTAVDPAPHMEAAARGVLGLPFHEDLIPAEVVEDDVPEDPWLGRVPLDVQDVPSVAPKVTIGVQVDRRFGAPGGVPGKPVSPGKSEDKSKGKDKPEKGKPGKPEKEKDSFKKRIGVLRYIVDHLDGDLPFPDGPKGPAWEFYTASVLNVEEFIRNEGIDALIYDPRGEVPSVGHGTPLDELDGHQLLALAADVRATAFDYLPDRAGFSSLEEAVKTTLHRIYEDLWSVVAYALKEEELTVDEKGLLRFAPEEENQDAEHALLGY